MLPIYPTHIAIQSTSKGVKLKETCQGTDCIVHTNFFIRSIAHACVEELGPWRKKVGGDRMSTPVC